LFCMVLSLGHAQVQKPDRTDVAPPPSDRFPASWYPSQSNVAHTFAPERGAPYTATLVVTSRFADQSAVKEASQTNLQTRDGVGRLRVDTEVHQPDGHGGTVTIHHVEVDDPVSHCSFRWTEPVIAPEKPMAVVSCSSRTLYYTEQSRWADVMITEPKEEHTLPNEIDISEPMGRRVIEGLDAVGMRKTRRLIDPKTRSSTSSVTEIWYSPSLHELLEMRQLPSEQVREANSLTVDMRLSNVKRGEPPASLFYPPAGYKIEPGH
jgi:hypothetical protein